MNIHREHLGMTETTVPVAAWQIGELVQMYQHRLMVLEVELDEAFRGGRLNKRLVLKRIKKIRILQSALSTITAFSEASQLGSDPTLKETELPLVEACNEEEVKICRAFLDAKMQAARQAEKAAHECVKWVKSGVPSVPFLSWLWIALRLSKLKVLMMKVNRETESVRRDCHTLGQYLQGIASGGKGKNRNSQEGSHVRLAVDTFNRLQQQASRVIGLRNRVRAEKMRNQQMVSWLFGAEKSFKQIRPVQAPPTPYELQDNTKTLFDVVLQPIIRSRRRLGLLQRFLGFPTGAIALPSARPTQGKSDESAGN